MEYVPGAGMVQAQAPPSRVGDIVERQEVGSERTPVVTAPPVGTTGTTPGPVGPLETARRPTGINGVFIELESRRYFSDGAAVPFDEKLFTRAGDYHGFAVFRQSGQADTVYIPSHSGDPKRLTPYRAR
jgi:hypothetical protein